MAGNRSGCGITLAGHNIAAVGGIHDDRIIGNHVVGNGLAGVTFIDVTQPVGP